MNLELKSVLRLTMILSWACLVSATVLTAAAYADDPGADSGVQPLPGVVPVMPKDLSMPEDCKVIDDELALIKKFSKNPNATPKQLEANAARADKLEGKRKDAQCPPADAVK